MGRELKPTKDSAAQAELGHALRMAMRGTGTSVSAVTTAKPDGSWRGATVNSLVSVSLSPPAILVSLNSASRIHATVLEVRRFAVNIFALQHAEIAAAFADPMRHDERFTTGPWQAGETGMPVLTDAVASLECVVDATLPYATHTIIVGKVIDVHRDPTAAPLIYHDGRYGDWSAVGKR